eukprot:GHVU01223864.1.p1 GENE.GHVU01223864.1~~GHVU01223864.1.p1  ORF type:complete len:124 (+),score=3.04 GHVU01223864.1:361-732(+)
MKCECGKELATLNEANVEKHKNGSEHARKMAELARRRKLEAQQGNILGFLSTTSQRERCCGYCCCPSSTGTDANLVAGAESRSLPSYRGATGKGAPTRVLTRLLLSWLAFGFPWQPHSLSGHR